MTDQLCDTCIYAKKADAATPISLFKWAIGLIIGFMLVLSGWLARSQAGFEAQYKDEVKSASALIKENKEILIELRTNQTNIKSEIEKLRGLYENPRR